MTLYSAVFHDIRDTRCDELGDGPSKRHDFERLLDGNWGPERCGQLLGRFIARLDDDEDRQLLPGLAPPDEFDQSEAARTIRHLCAGDDAADPADCLQDLERALTIGDGQYLRLTTAILQKTTDEVTVRRIVSDDEKTSS